MVETLRYFSTRTEVSLEMESDHSDLISALTCGAQITWEVQGLIKQAHSLLKAFEHIKLAHIKRGSNRIADWIIRAQRKNKLSQNWVIQPPPALLELLCSEANEVYPPTFSQ